MLEKPPDVTVRPMTTVEDTRPSHHSEDHPLEWITKRFAQIRKVLK
jgi:hypothetical protein